MDAPRIGVLAIQGSFALHRRSLEKLGAQCRYVRRADELEGLEGLVIPGGESTVMSDLAREYGLFDALRTRGAEGLPIFGTCAGAILLAEGEAPECLGLAPVRFDRNAYGRQRESFHATCELAPFSEPFHCIFIRAPRLELSAEEARARDLEVLGRWRDDVILLRTRRLLLATFHPELTDDLRLHRHFLGLVRDASEAAKIILTNQ